MSGSKEASINLTEGPIGKLEFTFDIINFANMLNKKWGASYSSALLYAPLKKYILAQDLA